MKKGSVYGADTVQLPGQMAEMSPCDHTDIPSVTDQHLLNTDAPTLSLAARQPLSKDSSLLPSRVLPSDLLGEQPRSSP